MKMTKYYSSSPIRFIDGYLFKVKWYTKLYVKIMNKLSKKHYIIIDEKYLRDIITFNNGS